VRGLIPGKPHKMVERMTKNFEGEVSSHREPSDPGKVHEVSAM
jgi:hypothetical protein